MFHPDDEKPVMASSPAPPGPLIEKTAPGSVLEDRAVAVEQFLERHKFAVLLVISVIYFAGTALRARARPFWFDEIITLAAAQQPNLSATLKAARMIDAIPPFTHLIIHLVTRLFGTGEVVSRIPAMLGFWVFCLCLFGFVIRRVGMFFALTTLFLPFATDSYGYSFETRCYGILLGWGGLALFCWQSAAAGKKRTPALIGLSVALAGATLSHYYAVFILLPLAGGELLRTLRRRRIDWSIWMAYAVGLIPLALSIPAIRAVMKANTHPWARAHIRDYLDYYEGQFQHAIPFAVIAVVLLAGYFILAELKREPPDAARNRMPDYELFAAILLLAIPVAAITAALLIPPHFFTERYAMLAIAGFAVLTPAIAARLAAGRAGIGAVLVIAATVPFIGELSQAARGFKNPFDEEPMLRQALESSPVVVSDGILFLQAWYYAPEAARQRLAYVADIASAVRYRGSETINLNLLSIARVLPVPVIEYRNFAAPGKQFLIYSDGRSSWLIPKLLAEGGAVSVVSWNGSRMLVRARLK
jgi:hypothetical protein